MIHTWKQEIMFIKKIDDSLFNDLFGIAKSRKGARTVANILNACLDVIEKEGWSNLTQEKVAASAGIKAGTLRYYYSTKEDLTAAAVKHMAQQVRGMLYEIIDSSLTDPLEKFLNMIDAILIVNEQLSEVLVWELWTYSAHDKTANEMIVKYYNWITGEIADQLSELKPELDKATCFCRAAVIMSISDGSHMFVGKSLPKKPELKNIRNVLRESMLKVAGISLSETSEANEASNMKRRKKTKGFGNK